MRGPRFFLFKSPAVGAQDKILTQIELRTAVRQFCRIVGAASQQHGGLRRAGATLPTTSHNRLRLSGRAKGSEGEIRGLAATPIMH